MSTSKGSLPLRVPFDSLTLAGVVAELRPLVVGGQIQDIRQPEPHELLLTIRSQGHNVTLLLSADARFARVHLTTQRKPNAPSPSAFCTALRRHLESGRIVSVRQRDFDRIFEIEVQSQTGEGTLEVNTLIAELMGKHSNLILVNAHNTVLEAAKRISHRINRLRETLPGKPYLPPPPVQPGKAQAVALEGITFEALANALIENVGGISPFLAREVAFRTLQDPPVSHDKLVAALNRITDAVVHGTNQPSLLLQPSSKGAYPIEVLHLPVTQRVGTESLNALLDTVFSFQMERAELDAALHELDTRLNREIRKLEKQQHDVERTLQEGKRADDYQQQGELLLAHLWKIETGAKQTAVQDFYSPDQTERTILLDPKLNPQENAQAYFRRAHKARDAQAQAHKQATDLEFRSKTLATALQQHRTYQEDPDCTAGEALAFLSRLIAEGIVREEQSAPSAQPSGPDFQGHKIRRYTTPEGYEIYCGETATANDFLTTRVASPNDLWLHVRASPGSHVVIRTKGAPDKVPQSVLHRAAMIAALHSNQKHSGLVPIDYTLKKYVRKPRGAAPGSVEVQREKTLHVAPHEDAERT